VSWPPLLRRLRWSVPDAVVLEVSADKEAMARTFAYLYGAGATLVLLTLLFPFEGERFLPGMIAPPVVAYGMVGLLLVGFDRLPLWLFRTLPGAGSILISAIAYSSGDGAGAYAMFYFWVVLSAFYFFSFRQAAPNLVLVAVAYALVLEFHDGFANRALHWTMAIGALSVSGFLLALLRGQIKHLVGRMVADLQRRVSAEKRLRGSEALLAEAQQIARLGSWEWDIAANRVTWSEELYRIYGVDPASFGSSYEAFLELVHPDDRAFVDSVIRKALEDGAPFEFHHQIVRPADGAVRIVHGRGEVVAGEAGEQARMFGTCQDVTEQRQAEEALARSEEQYRLMAENSTDMICVSSAEGTLHYVSPACRTLLGYEPEELLGRSTFELVHGDDLEAVRDAYAGLRGGEAVTVSYRCWRKDRGFVWLESTLRPIRDERSGSIVELQATSRDVGERKRAEVRLRASEERLRLIIDTAQEAFLSIDAEGLIRDWNPQAERTFGWRRDEVLGRPLAGTIIPPAYREAHKQGLQRFVTTGESRILDQSLELPALHRDGHEFPVELTISPVRSHESYVFHAFLRDITERRRAADYFAAQHEVTKVLAESATLEDAQPRILETLGTSMGWDVGGFWSVDPDANVLRCDAVWQSRPGVGASFVELSREITFAAGEPLPGRVWKTRKPAWVPDITADASFTRAPLALGAGLRGAIGLPLMSEGEILGVLDFFSPEMRRPDEDLLAMMTSLGVQIGQFVKRKLAEREAERLKDEFFGLVSHELRTPLASILGYMELVLNGGSDLDEETRRFLEVVERNAKRQLRLVGDLLFVAKADAGKFSVQLETVSLRELLSACVEAARPKAEEREIELVLEAEPVSKCAGDPDRLAQLFDNLLSNALKYTPPNGRVSVRLRRYGDRAIVEVEDSGIGIAPQEQERLFERFFRASGAVERVIPGVGVGLTIARAIVEAHGGDIAVTSREGAGTTFTVTLPLRIPSEVDSEAAASSAT
jgi:PAS domain S-box-containing protein